MNALELHKNETGKGLRITKNIFPGVHVYFNKLKSHCAFAGLLLVFFYKPASPAMHCERMITTS